jgi:Mg-chelatase subunit ChlD
MARGRRRCRGVAKLVIAALFVLASARACTDGREAPDPAEVARQIDAQLSGSGARGEPREGIAAVVLMDVSRSMDERLPDGERKISVARRATVELVRQFHSYAAAHPEEPVLLGLFEFSANAGASTREIVPLSRPDVAAAEAAVSRMRADGGTPIGEAMVAGKLALDRAGLSRRHLLVVTDGENTDGVPPEAVMAALGRRPEAERASVYFVAFDIAASRFNAVRETGGLVLEAANAIELTQTLDTLLTGKILVEGP